MLHLNIWCALNILLTLACVICIFIALFVRDNEMYVIIGCVGGALIISLVMGRILWKNQSNDLEKIPFVDHI